MNPISDALVALSRADVRYVVVGGVAAVMQGVERVTYDLDLVVELTEASCLGAIDALLGIGYRSRIPADPHGFASAATREAWVREKNMMVFSFFDTTSRRAQIDIFVRYPLAFDSLWERATRVEVEGHEIRLAAPEHLVRMKREAGRPKDLEDIKALGFPLQEDADDPSDG